jgi:uncharacterized protein YkwD
MVSNQKCVHYYEWRHGRFVCAYCGRKQYPKHAIKYWVKISSICIVIIVVGFFVYTNDTIKSQITTLLSIISNTISTTTKTVTIQETRTLPAPTYKPLIVMNSGIYQEPKQEQHSLFQETLTYHGDIAPNNNGQPTIKIPELEQRIHLLINEQRQANGISVLSFDPQLSLIARGHSQDMATRNYFEHDTPEGLTFSDRYKQAGYNCQTQFDVTGNSYMISGGGENIFQNNLYNSVEYTNGYPTHYDWNDMSALANSTVDGWMNSQGHKKNILTPYFQNEGIGVAISNDSKVYITEDFC